MAMSEIAADFRRMELGVMAPAELLAEARKGGLAVLARGDRLVVRGPKNAEHDLVQALLRRKAELMPLLAEPTEEEREWLMERAAIMEYEGGLGREEADRRAWEELLARRGRESADVP